MLKTVVHFKNKESEWHIGLKIEFDGHADDKAAVRKAVMKEVAQRWPDAKGFVQQIEVK